MPTVFLQLFYINSLHQKEPVIQRTPFRQGHRSNAVIYFKRKNVFELYKIVVSVTRVGHVQAREVKRNYDKGAKQTGHQTFFFFYSPTFTTGINPDTWDSFKCGRSQQCFSCTLVCLHYGRLSPFSEAFSLTQGPGALFLLQQVLQAFHCCEN